VKDSRLMDNIKINLLELLLLFIKFKEKVFVGNCA
jgi:hypothetical protein